MSDKHILFEMPAEEPFTDTTPLLHEQSKEIQNNQHLIIKPLDDELIKKFHLGHFTIKTPIWDLYISANKQYIHVEVPGITKVVTIREKENIIFIAERVNSLKSIPLFNKNMFCGIYAMKITTPDSAKLHKTKIFNDGTVTIAIKHNYQIWDKKYPDRKFFGKLTKRKLEKKEIKKKLNYVCSKQHKMKSLSNK
jgi:hypothetical protein